MQNILKTTGTGNTPDKLQRLLLSWQRKAQVLWCLMSAWFKTNFLIIYDKWANLKILHTRISSAGFVTLQQKSYGVWNKVVGYWVRVLLFSAALTCKKYGWAWNNSKNHRCILVEQEIRVQHEKAKKRSDELKRMKKDLRTENQVSVSKVMKTTMASLAVSLSWWS